MFVAHVLLYITANIAWTDDPVIIPVVLLVKSRYRLYPVGLNRTRVVYNVLGVLNKSSLTVPNIKGFINGGI